MTTHCSSCAWLDEPGNGPHCGSCVFPVVGMPSGHVPFNSQPSDTQRLDWMLPLMSLDDDLASVGDKRTAALGAALRLGKSGREAIDYAMEGSP